MLALGGGEAYEWNRYQEKAVVTGPWPAFEREAAAAIIQNAWWSDVNSEFGHAREPDELIVYGSGGSWARVRVTVEVLDGVL